MEAIRPDAEQRSVDDLEQSQERVQSRGNVGDARTHASRLIGKLAKAGRMTALAVLFIRIPISLISGLSRRDTADHGGVFHAANVVQVESRRDRRVDAVAAGQRRNDAVHAASKTVIGSVKAARAKIRHDARKEMGTGVAS